jgi:hypothetical protein
MQRKTNKKLKIDLTAQAESNNNQADLVANPNQITKVNLRTLKSLVTPIIKSFANGISEFDTFKIEMAKTQEYAETNTHILFAFLEALEIPHKNPAKQTEHKERVFSWFLDEVDSRLSDLKAHYAGSVTKREQAENVILKLASYYSCYDKIVSKPSLKQWIEEEFFIKIVLRLISSETPESKNPLEFINKYFPNNGIDLLKKYTEKSNAFLDLVLQCRIYEHILTFWDNGCRPNSQEKFNSNLFQKNYTWDKSLSIRAANLQRLEKLYKTIISSEKYKDFLKFQEVENVNMLFISNAAVTKELYVSLQEKLKLPTIIDHSALIECCTYNHDEAELMFAANKSSELLEKKLFLIKSVDSLANVETVKKIEISLEVLTKYMRNYICYNLLKTCDNFKSIEPQQTIALNLFFNLLLSMITSDLKLYDGNIEECIASIKNLYDLFKSNNVNQLQLLRVFLYAQLSVVVSAGTYQQNIFNQVLAYIYKDISDADIAAICKQYTAVLEQLASKLGSNIYIHVAFVDSINDFISVLLHQTPDVVKADLFRKPDSDIIKSMAKFIYYKWKARPDFEHQRGAVIHNDFLVLKKIDNKNDFIPKFIVNLLADYNNFNESTKKDLLVQLNRETKDWVRYLSDTNDLLSQLLKCLFNNNNSIDAVIFNINLIIDMIKETPGCKIPKTFLANLAPLSLNKALREACNENARKYIEELDNVCIHLAEQTGQSKEYEDIKTEYLKKTNIDPANDTQAIHAAANHAYADKIYNDWKQKIPGGLTPAIMKSTFQFLISYVNQKLLSECNNAIRKQYNDSIQSVLNIEDSQMALTALRSKYPLPNNPAPVSALNSLELVIKINLYIRKIQDRANMVPQNQNDRMMKQDALKLLELMSMILYFASNTDTSRLFNDKNEALKILVAELTDQVQNPSCDQGPFMRYLMALEVVCPSIKFPKINRRNIMFIINDFINRSYDEMEPASKIQLIKEIYNLLDEEEKEQKNLDGNFPDGAFKSFIEKFMESNKDRLELFTKKDITDFFTIPHPLDFHKTIASAVNEYMEKLQQSVHRGATNTLFSGNNQANNNNNDNNGDNLMPQLH